MRCAVLGAAGPEKTVCIVYSPELRSFLSVPEAFLGTRLRHAMSWSRDMESFVPLNKYAKAELLEGCSLDGSDSSASRLLMHMFCYVVTPGLPADKLQGCMGCHLCRHCIAQHAVVQRMG